jgi:hypothetical protein
MILWYHESVAAQVHEIMAELDLDQSGTIAVAEFLDKLKQAESERRADMRRDGLGGTDARPGLRGAHGC